jgi:hypothetical protein
MLVAACSQGEGEGRITGTLEVPNCWSGAFELSPDFFGAVPYRESLQLRIQSGSDNQNFSDGVSILINDIGKIRPGSGGGAGRYKEALVVDMPPEVTPPGVPIEATPEPALVGMTLYLQRSCRTQNVTLHAVQEVAIPNDGSCVANAVMGGDPTQGCDPTKESPAGLGNGRSVIAFTSVANGKLDEETAAERLTSGCFDVYLADPRDSPQSAVGAPHDAAATSKGPSRSSSSEAAPHNRFRSLSGKRLRRRQGCFGLQDGTHAPPRPRHPILARRSEPR